MESLADVDWATWAPDDVATLLFVRRGRELLLIRKKRGLGAGKINAPGGRLEPGETAIDAARRETEEEVCVTPTGIEPAGQLRFQFVDGYKLECWVFTATGFEGTPAETDEADPRWVSIDALPWEEMWSDDAIWLPMLLEGRGFDGRFVFDGERMLAHEVLSQGEVAG